MEDCPDEVILCILEFLSIQDIFSFARASRRMASLCRDRSLWRRRYLREFPDATPRFSSAPAHSQRDWRASVAHATALENKWLQCRERAPTALGAVPVPRKAIFLDETSAFVAFSSVQDGRIGLCLFEHFPFTASCLRGGSGDEHPPSVFLPGLSASHAGIVCDMVLSVDFEAEEEQRKEVLVTGSMFEGTIGLWEVSKVGVHRRVVLRQVLSPPDENKHLSSLCLHPSKPVLFASGEHTIWAWDLRTGTLINTRHNAGTTLRSMAADAASGTLFSGDEAGVLRMWDLETLAPKAPPLAAFENCVTTMCIRPEARQLIVGSRDTTVKIFHLPQMHLLWHHCHHRDSITRVHVHDNILLTSSRDGTVGVCLLRPPNFRVVQKIRIADEGKWVSMAQVVPGTTNILVGATDDQLELWA